MRLNVHEDTNDDDDHYDKDYEDDADNDDDADGIPDSHPLVRVICQSLSHQTPQACQ